MSRTTYDALVELNTAARRLAAELLRPLERLLAYLTRKAIR